MMSGKLVRFPMRHPDMFTPEINCEVLSHSEMRRVLYAAIQALPHVQDRLRQEELKSALCDLLLKTNNAA
ncbi:MAG TPA: hypothetical protein VFA89_18375 [Terriglobales bacterium]|nr:hypothetical protein [Terriglobales bacterium]